MANAPQQKAPETAPATPSAASEVKITLNTTKGKLVDLRQRLGVEGVVDPKKEKEIKDIEKRFEADKDKILTISQKSIDALKADINDANEAIDGKFDVKPDGELIFEAKADAEPAKPEAPIEKKIEKELIKVDMSAPLPDETKKNIEELKTQDKPGWYAFVELLSKIPFIGSFFAGFLWLNEGEKPEDINRDINMIGTILTKTSGNTSLMERLGKWMFSEKKSLISAIRSQPELLRGPNIDPKRLQIYLAHVLQQEPITWSDIYGFLVGQITSYPASDVNLSGVTQAENTTPSSAEVAPSALLVVPNSPDMLANKLTEAQKADKDLEDAKKIAPETEDSKKKVIEAQSKVDEIKKYAKDEIKKHMDETDKSIASIERDVSTKESNLVIERKANPTSEQTTKIEQELVKIKEKKTNLDTTKTDIAKFNLEITDTSIAADAVLTLNKVMKSVEIGERTAAHESKDETEIWPKIAKISATIKEIQDIKGDSGKKMLSVTNIDSLNTKYKQILSDMVEVKRLSDAGSPELKQKVQTIKDQIQKITDYLGTKFIASEIKAKYNESVKDWSEKESDITTIEPVAILWYTADKKTAYIEVTNFGAGKASWVLRLRSDTTDTNTSFYHFSDAEKEWSPENKNMRIQQVESNAMDYNFRTIELDWTGYIYDDDLDWRKKDFPWVDQIKSKLGIDLG